MKYLKKFNEGKKKSNFKKLLVDGFVVYQGKDAEGNDHVTMEVASDDDYWFHAKGVPGSHVVVIIRDNIPSEETIKKVATIAAKSSKSKGPTTVVYCKKKFVKKENGMNAGKVKVDYTNAYEISI